MTARRTAASGRFEPKLLDGYRPTPGVADEMLDASGHLKPGWDRLVAALDQMTARDREARFQRADQYLREAGVYYRIYGEDNTREREWPLAHVPLIIGGAEWRDMSAGLIERAELLERIVRDIYGPNDLVSKGLLPPRLVAGNPEFLHPLVDAEPVGGHFLHFIGFELGRGRDGRWQVLGDRTQAASGAGFALENRVATRRAFSDGFADIQVERLAGFFRNFREALFALSQDPAARAAILTPGPLNETYYEHAWIARYLGIALLEGEDLRVVGGKVMVRTVSGLQPIGVIWRRIDAAFMDPLELRGDSWLGTPGLAEALRNRAVAMVNALGSGIVESRALLAFMPGIARALNGADLKLPSIATWWCGQEAEKRYVLEHLDRMVVGPALSTRLPFEDPDAVLASRLDSKIRAALVTRLEADGENVVAQEAITLSTMPIHVDGRLEPRPVTLRVFAARTADGWIIMPGGLARIGNSLDPTAIAMQRGGATADVWVVSDSKTSREPPFQADHALLKEGIGTLPSRAAENLMWLGRYSERLEGTVRILRAYHVRLAETADPDLPLLELVRGYLDALGIDADDPVTDGLVRMIDNATGSAGQIRDRFSPDGWLALKDLSKTLRGFADHIEPGDDAARAMTVILRKLAGFSGLVHENMYRFTGWRFLEIGRRIERGIHMARLAAALATHEHPDGALDLLLEIGDSVLTHRRQYHLNARWQTVIDLLALDPLNPRSIKFQLDRLAEEIALLPMPDAAHPPRPDLAIEKLRVMLTDKVATALDPGSFSNIIARLGDLSDKLSRSYFA